MMEDKLVTVASFTDYVEAELAKQTLEDCGIQSVVTGENVANVCRGLDGLIDLDLQVIESQAQRAKEILESEGKREQ